MYHVAVTIVKEDKCGFVTGDYNMKFIKTNEDFIVLDKVRFDFKDIPVGECSSYQVLYEDGELGENDYILFIMILRVK